MNEHLVITYSQRCADSGHIDPNFNQLVYGDSGRKGKTIENHITSGSYVFFNTRIGGQRYITAYFYIDKVLKEGEHDAEIRCLNCSAKTDEIILIGNRFSSKILTIPLPLDKELMMKLTSFEADEEYFERKSNHTELVAIRDKTLNHKIISEEEKELLIKLCKNRG